MRFRLCWRLVPLFLLAVVAHAVAAHAQPVRPPAGPVPTPSGGAGNFLVAASDDEVRATVIAGLSFTLSRPVTCRRNGVPVSDTVDLSLDGPPPGAIPTFQPNPASAGGTFLLTLPLPLTTPAGEYLMQVRGRSRRDQDKGCGEYTPLQVRLSVRPAVRLKVEPPVVSIPAGAPATFQITIDRLNFSDFVGLSAAGLPPGLTATFDPRRTTGNRSTLTIATPVLTDLCRPPLGCAFEVRGTPAGVVKAEPARLVIAPVVTFALAPRSTPAVPDDAVSLNAVVVKVGYSGPVGLDVEVVGLAPVHYAATLTPPVEFTSEPGIRIDLRIADTAPPGKYKVRATPKLPAGTQGVSVVADEAELEIRQAPVLSVGPTPKTAATGTTATFQITRQPANDPTPVTFEGVAGFPPGTNPTPNATLNPTSLAIALPNDVPAGTYRMQLLTSFLVGTRKVTRISNDFELVVQAGVGSVELRQSEGLVRIAAGTSRDFTVEVVRLGGYAGSLILTTARNLQSPPPPGTQAMPIPTSQVPPATGNSLVTVRVTVDPGVPSGGPYVFEVTGTATPATVPVQPTQIQFEVEGTQKPTVRLGAMPSLLDQLELGKPRQATITVTSENGFAGPVEIGIFFPPNKASTVLAQDTFNLPANTTLSTVLTVTDNGLVGQESVTIEVFQPMAGPNVVTVPTVVTLKPKGSFPAPPPPPPPPALPTVSGFFPVAGPPGTNIEVSGSGFVAPVTVSFNGAPAAVTSLAPGLLRATVPNGATSGPIRVTTPGGTATSGTSFTVSGGPPIIAGLLPSSGPVGTGVTISGSRLMGTTKVTFNGVSTPFTVASDEFVIVGVPAGATTGLVRVETPNGTATSPIPFTVQ